MSDDDYSKPLWRTSGFKAFCICMAIFGVGALIETSLWRAGGMAICVVAIVGVVVFQWSRDWRHPFRWRRGGTFHRTPEGITAEFGDDNQ